MVLDRLVLSGEKSKESVASGAVQLSLDGTVEQAQFVMIFVGVYVESRVSSAKR